MGDQENPSAEIDAIVAELGDWRGETLSRIRDLIREADPDIVEEWKVEVGLNMGNIPLLMLFKLGLFK